MKATELLKKQHREVKARVVALVLDELPDVDVDDERFEAKVTVLDELIEHHVEEEEHEMFKIAEKLAAERLAELGDEMASPTNGASAAPRRGKR